VLSLRLGRAASRLRRAPRFSVGRLLTSSTKSLLKKPVLLRAEASLTRLWCNG
jgi:hypothetical protein